MKMIKSDCIFCQIIKGEIPSHKIYEDDLILVFLDINPVNIGHCLVIPKEHFANLTETTEQIASRMMVVGREVGGALEEAISADGFNLGLNNGVVAGQVVSHVHLHVMPRYQGDGLNLWPGKSVSSVELKKVSEKIRHKLKKDLV